MLYRLSHNKLGGNFKVKSSSKNSNEFMSYVKLIIKITMILRSRETLFNELSVEISKIFLAIRYTEYQYLYTQTNFRFHLILLKFAVFKYIFIAKVNLYCLTLK